MCNHLPPTVRFFDENENEVTDLEYGNGANDETLGANGALCVCGRPRLTLSAAESKRRAAFADAPQAVVWLPWVNR